MIGRHLPHPPRAPLRMSAVESSDDEESRATLKKRRNLKKRTGTAAKGPLGVKSKVARRGKQIANDSEAEVAGADRPAENKCPSPDQLKYYSGTTLELLEEAIFLMRLYLLNNNGFPPTAKLYKCAKYCFRAACRSRYGASWRGQWHV